MKKLSFFALLTCIVCMMSSCLLCGETGYETTGTRKDTISVQIFDSLNAPWYITYAKYLCTHTLTVNGVYYGGIVSKLSQSVFCGDSMKVIATAEDNRLKSITISMDGQPVQKMSSFPDSCSLRMDSAGLCNIYVSYSFRYTDKGISLFTGYRTIVLYMPYDWVSEFHSEYDRYNADMAILNFDTYNFDDDNVPIDSVVLLRKNDNVIKSLSTLPKTFCDTVPILDDSIFHYSLTGYMEGIPCGTTDYSVVAHKGEIVFSEENLRHLTGTIILNKDGSLPND